MIRLIWIKLFFFNVQVVSCFETSVVFDNQTKLLKLFIENHCV